MSTRIIAGRYELLEKIGDGGMAVVYKAKDKLLNRMVAVKILKPEFTKDAKFIESFRKESHAAASLNHQNIVNVYDVGREGNINYIVMELIEGYTLSELIYDTAPMPYKTVVDLAKQIAAGLSVAHKRGIIHRDIKPHNILITEEGVAKITDFGIAKAISSTTITSGTSENIMGSVHYFSPEQARGGFVDEKSDIYSLGIVIYEMLTGKIPFDGENPVSVALMHINNDMPSPSDLVAGIPPRLEHITIKSTMKQPEDRYNSIEELIKEFNNIEVVGRVVGESFSNIKNRPNAELDEEFEEEIETKSNKKKKKILLIVGISVGALLMIGGILALTLGLFGGNDVEVPNVKGLTYEEAEEKLKEFGLNIDQGEPIFSEEYEIDTVAGQTPEVGDSVKEGSTVTVNLSKGDEEGLAPNVVGMQEDDARKKIEEEGYKVGSVTTTESEKPEGEVIEQDPVGGATVKAGDTINIVLSDGKGKEEGTVPSLVGKTLDMANRAIVDAGFVLGTISYETSSTYAKQQVMWQQYAANTNLPKGTTINVTVSDGPAEPEPEPEP